jgi:hypothetical protein
MHSKTVDDSLSGRYLAAMNVSSLDSLANLSSSDEFRTVIAICTANVPIVL